jgi:DNA repair exonuclease SbcCD ATPase subunit
VVAQYRALEANRENLRNEISELDSLVMSYNLKLIALPVYDNAKPDIIQEYSEVEQKITIVKAQIEIRTALEISLAKNNHMVELFKNDQANAVKASEQNIKRVKYLNILNGLYEMLNTSQFPRKLIQTYAGTVSEYLTENLKHFSFPYRAEVNDNFGIDVFDSCNRKLPSVSGGQEIMIGVALRLALHTMFGEAFPIMIFDEGSVHLSQESKKSYFEVIKNMKNISKFKQVIIIDHDEDLEDVVDNTIKL